MTDEPSARDDLFTVAERVYLALEDLTGAQGIALIESALRRERAMGMREADERTVENARIASYAGILLNDAEWQCVLMAMDRLAYPSDTYRSAWTKVSNIAFEHRARETEGQT